MSEIWLGVSSTFTSENGIIRYTYQNETLEGQRLRAKYNTPVVQSFPGQGILETEKEVLRCIKSTSTGEHVLALYLGANNIRKKSDNVENVVSSYDTICRTAQSQGNKTLLIIAPVPSPCWKKGFCKEDPCVHEIMSKIESVKLTKGLKNLAAFYPNVKFVDPSNLFLKRVGDNLMVDRQYYRPGDVHFNEYGTKLFLNKIISALIAF